MIILSPLSSRQPSQLRRCLLQDSELNHEKKNRAEHRPGIRTADVKSYIVGVAVVFGANLATVIAFVGRLHVLNNQAPLGRSLIVVDADACVRRELEQSDRQRMNLVAFTPRYLPSSSSQYHTDYQIKSNQIY